MSLIRFVSRRKSVRFTNPDSAEISLIWLLNSSSQVRFVNPASGVMSTTLLYCSKRAERLVAYSRPVRSKISLLIASRYVRVSISDGMGLEMPNASSTADFRLGSAKWTGSSASAMFGISSRNKKKIVRLIVNLL